MGQWAVFGPIFVGMLVFSEGIELKAENLFGKRWSGMPLFAHFLVSSLHLPRVGQRQAFLRGLFLAILLPPAEHHATSC